MIKKFTAFSFLIIANIILLAHAIIPHHHHQKQVCLESKHCGNHTLTHNNGYDHDNHQHDSNNNPISCFLSQLVIVPTNRAYQICQCQHSDDHHSHEFQNIIYSYNPGVNNPITKYRIIVPEIIPLYNSFVCSSSGLRGPPLV